MKYLKIDFFPSPFPWWSHSIVLRNQSAVIIGIVDRIKINSEQPLPFSESQLFIPYFLQIVRITYVCFVYFAAIAQVCINFHRQHVWQWWCERGAKSHVSKEISGRGRRRSRGVKGNQGVGDFRFINILQFFSIYYYYYYFFLSFFPYFFTHDIYPHPHPRPTTSTHYPRPTTFSYTLYRGRISSFGRALHCRAGGRRFDSRDRTKNDWEMKVLPLPCKRLDPRVARMTT